MFVFIVANFRILNFKYDLKYYLYIKVNMIDPTMKKIAQNYLCEKKICRKCFARLNKRAKNCRKCCSSDLRIKKKIK